MKKKKIMLVISVILLVILIIGVDKVKETKRQERFDRAKELFEQEVLTFYQMESASIGFSDIEIEFVYHVSDEKNLILEVNAKYHSEMIDNFYKDEWEEENCRELHRIFKEMQLLLKNKVKWYSYEIDGESVLIIWNDDAVEMSVSSCQHRFKISTHRLYDSVSVDGETIFCYFFEEEEQKERAEKIKRAAEQAIENQQASDTQEIEKEKHKYDPYNVYDYVDADDFYDENYEEFDDFEDAEDYYDYAMEELE